MPTTTIPFSLPLTARTWAKAIGSSAKDQQLINAFYETASDNEQGSKILYVTKRAGSTTGTTLGTTPIAVTTYSDQTGLTQLFVSLPGGTPTLYADDIFPGATIVGTMTGSGIPIQTSNIFPDGIIAGNGVVCFTDDGQLGYFLFEDAISTNFPTFTGDTHTNSVIDNIASTTGIYVGQLVSGTGIQAATRVASITSATAITVTPNTTATNAGVTITKEALARITSANFPTSAGTMTTMDGFFYVSEAGTQRIYNSKLNDPATWTSGDYITADFGGDNLYFIFRHQDMIVAAGAKGTVEYFRRGQTSSGTVLTKVGADRTIQMLGIPVFHVTGHYFLGASGGAAVGLFKMNGMEFTPVSDDITTSVIQQMYAGSSGLIQVGTAAVGDKEGILIFGTGLTTSLFYDPKTNNFTPLSMATAITSAFAGVFTKASTNTDFAWATGNTWQDSSSAFTMTAQTQPISFNQGRGFIINWVELLADTESSGSATLSISGDDYVNFRSPGSFDLTKTTKRVHRCGYYRNHAIFKVEDSGNNPARFQALFVNWEPCSA